MPSNRDAHLDILVVSQQVSGEGGVGDGWLVLDAREDDPSLARGQPPGVGRGHRDGGGAASTKGHTQHPKYTQVKYIARFLTLFNMGENKHIQFRQTCFRIQH